MVPFGWFWCPSVVFDFSYGIIAAVISIIIGFFIPSKFKFYYFIFVPITLYIALKYFIFYEELIELGKLDGLNWVETGAWGGLSLTFIISFFCLIFCFRTFVHHQDRVIQTYNGILISQDVLLLICNQV